MPNIITRMMIQPQHYLSRFNDGSTVTKSQGSIQSQHSLISRIINDKSTKSSGNRLFIQSEENRQYLINVAAAAAKTVALYFESVVYAGREVTTYTNGFDNGCYLFDLMHATRHVGARCKIQKLFVLFITWLRRHFFCQTIMSERDTKFYLGLMALTKEDEYQGSPNVIAQINLMFFHHHAYTNKATEMREDLFHLWMTFYTEGLNPTEILVLANSLQASDHNTMVHQVRVCQEKNKTRPDAVTSFDHLNSLSIHTVARRFEKLCNDINTSKSVQCRITADSEEGKNQRLKTSARLMLKCFDEDHKAAVVQGKLVIEAYLRRQWVKAGRPVVANDACALPADISRFANEFVALLQGTMRYDAVRASLPIHCLQAVLELVTTLLTDRYFAPDLVWNEIMMPSSTMEGMKNRSAWAPLLLRRASWFEFRPSLVYNKLYLAPFATIILSEDECRDPEGAIEKHLKRYRTEVRKMADRGTKDSIRLFA